MGKGPRPIGVVVGTLLLVTNARTLLLEVGVAGPVRLPILLAIAAGGGALARHVRREHQRAAASVGVVPPLVPERSDGAALELVRAAARS